MQNPKHHGTALLITLAALCLALAPIEARAQLRDSPQSATRSTPPVQDSLSMDVRDPVPPLHRVPRRDQFLRLPSNSGWTFRLTPLSLARPEDLSAAQNLLWGTVGLTLTVFSESSPRRHQATWSRRTTWSRHGPGRTVPSPRPRGLLPPPRHRGRDPVRRRSMEALVEGLFRVGS